MNVDLAWLVWRSKEKILVYGQQRDRIDVDQLAGVIDASLENGIVGDVWLLVDGTTTVHTRQRLLS